MYRTFRVVALLAASISSVSAGPFPKPDLIVAADGSGNFKTIQAAVASIPGTNTERIVVLIKNGTYHEKIRVDASFVTLRGQSRHGTRIEFPQLNDATRMSEAPVLGRGLLSFCLKGIGA